MVTVNGLIRRMSPATMVALLGDLVDMGVNDTGDREIVALVARELISNVGGEEAADMLVAMAISHQLIDSELENARDKEDEE
jgi:hypothetical protein